MNFLFLLLTPSIWLILSYLVNNLRCHCFQKWFFATINVVTKLTNYWSCWKVASIVVLSRMVRPFIRWRNPLLRNCNLLWLVKKDEIASWLVDKILRQTRYVVIGLEHRARLGIKLKLKEKFMTKNSRIGVQAKNVFL